MSQYNEQMIINNDIKMSLDNQVIRYLQIINNLEVGIFEEITRENYTCFVNVFENLVVYLLSFEITKIRACNSLVILVATYYNSI